MRWRLLEGVSDSHVQRLLAVARRRRFSRREVVSHRDDVGDSLHLIVKGRFAIQIMTPVGDTVTVAVRVRGESFGEMALIGAEPRRTATVLALEEAETFAGIEATSSDYARRTPRSTERCSRSWSPRCAY